MPIYKNINPPFCIGDIVKRSPVRRSDMYYDYNDDVLPDGLYEVIRIEDFVIRDLPSDHSHALCPYWIYMRDIKTGLTISRDGQSLECWAGYLVKDVFMNAVKKAK